VNDPKIRKAEHELNKRKIVCLAKKTKYAALCKLSGQGACSEADLNDAREDFELADQDVKIAECDLEIARQALPTE